jgi:hypothetical protein
VQIGIERTGSLTCFRIYLCLGLCDLVENFDFPGIIKFRLVGYKSLESYLLTSISSISSVSSPSNSFLM